MHHGNGQEVSRRKFLTYFVGATAAAISAVVSVPLVGYFLSPIWRKGEAITTPIARTDDIPVSRPTFVTYEERVRDGWYITTRSKGAWVVTKNGKDFVLFDPRCTHLNCPYYWDRELNRFHCPCHDGRYDIDGAVIGGPPPRPLDRLEFVIREGNILVTGRVVRGV